MTKSRLAVAVLATLLPAAALHAQAPAPAPKPATPAAAPKPATPAAPKPAAAQPQGKTLYTQAQFDLLLRERMAQGQPDSPELRNAVRDELNTRALLVQEARKKGLEKKEDVKTQMDLASQTVLVRAYVNDWVSANPIPEEAMRKEYESIKSQIGDKEYKVAHILVEKEDEAKQVIADLQKGGKFDEIAKQRSKDPGSKDRGGDLDWNAPGNFVKPFSDAMVKVEKGKFTPQPIQSPFGWHVIRVDDVRDAKVPAFEEVKPQLQQRMQQQAVERYLRDLRAKNGV
ncbi:MAG: peptidylprolyl isomerase [Burkholderiales bacterium]|nr:peptidylprolyl isomerase [Burkholderiales bacterium]GIK85051.1 MAG: peptidylprolyl isomerase [Betaproteobacteria bacterium]